MLKTLFGQKYTKAFIDRVAWRKAQYYENRRLRTIRENATKMAYNWAIENGIAKEQARSVLPEGNTISKLYVNGTIRSWIHYVELRSAHGTQKEHMELARVIGEAISSIFPQMEDFIHGSTDTK